MEHPFVAENEQERTRLRALVGRLNDHAFAVKVGGGWTVAATLARMAFWDRLALVRIRRAHLLREHKSLGAVEFNLDRPQRVRLTQHDRQRIGDGDHRIGRFGHAA